MAFFTPGEFTAILFLLGLRGRTRLGHITGIFVNVSGVCGVPNETFFGERYTQ